MYEDTQERPESGASFTKQLTPKMLLSFIQLVCNLRTS